MVPQTNLLSAVCAFFIALSTLFVGCYAQGPPKDSLNHNFTLAALNITEPNANLTGAPLVLGAGGTQSRSGDYSQGQIQHFLRCHLWDLFLYHIGLYQIFDYSMTL